MRNQGVERKERPFSVMVKRQATRTPNCDEKMRKIEHVQAEGMKLYREEKNGEG